MNRWVFWGFLVTLVTLSLLPTHHLGAAVFSLWDKAQHAIGFAVLTALAILAYPNLRRLRLGLALLLLGAGIEVAQSATGWRMGDWRDGLADAVGITVVLVFFHHRHRRMRP